MLRDSLLSILLLAIAVNPGKADDSSSREDLDAPPLVTAEAWAIADGETGEILWHESAHERRMTASLTKVMAALVVLERAETDPAVLGETITFSRRADRTGGSTSDVEEGEQVVVREALYGLLLPSGNDMGNAIAEHFHPRLDPPDASMRDLGLDNPIQEQRAGFLAEMNRLARRIGMENTFYQTAYGDGGPDGVETSCASDVIRLARHAMAHPLFREIVRTQRHVGTVRRPDGSGREQVWENTNELLGLDRGYDGIKTGFNRSARRCLLASGERDGRRLLVVVLGCDSARARWTDTRNLARWAWLQLAE